jgi:hypothetical protein
VTKFEKFIQENDSKRQRAEVKLKQEKKFLHAKRLEFTKAQTDLDAAEQVRVHMHSAKTRSFFCSPSRTHLPLGAHEND